ncbi:histidine phosphatase family protein [Methanocalculus sp.]|uniref:histidine phosphatase family protein n=1 Tax=Methanocalculus sp. TaxID=2004547 RepID=UPI00260C4BF8|nr:histidine phosphatase family protein [Methanocalculus sp.]MDG6251473.1 histidine phosphatase family protein [Methanocalculus sp.]
MNVNFMNNFSLVEESESFALLIRHAERGSIPSLTHGTDVLLTEKGTQDAQLFGSKLRDMAIGCTYSSPVPRCLQTVHSILDGYGKKDIPIIQSSILGAPGIYIEDSDLAGRNFLDWGTTTTVQRYIETGELEGFKPLKSTSKAFLSQICTDLSASGHNLIYVSHDAVLIPFISYFNDEYFDYKKWLTFLDGAIVTRGRDTVSIIRDGKKREVTGGAV